MNKTLKQHSSYERPEIEIIEIQIGHPLLDLSGRGNEKYERSEHSYSDEDFD